MNEDIISKLQAFLSISIPEVVLTMEDGSKKTMALDVEQICADLQDIKEFAARAAALEREADWLAVKCQKLCEAFSEHHFCDECPHHATADCPDAVGGVLDAHEINEWRMAARKAVEEQCKSS